MNEPWKQGLKFEQRADGAIRHGQLITIYGPGALIDFVNSAGVVAGLSWWAKGDPIVEDRLLALLSAQAGLAGVRLHTPPATLMNVAPEDRKLLRAVTFPEWFVCQNERCWSLGLAREWKGDTPPRRLLHFRELDGGRHKCAQGRGEAHPVSPVRFVRACPNGHLADLDWPRLVHDGPPCSATKLWMVEDGPSAELASVRVICSGCKGRGFAMSLAARRDGTVLGFCDESAPWLPGGKTPPAADPSSGCQQPWRLLLRSAGNSWFPVNAGVIHIPDLAADLREAVEAVFPTVQKATTPEKLDILLELVDEAKRVLDPFPRADVVEEIRRRVDGRPIQRKRVKQAELDALISAPSEADAFAASDESRAGKRRWLAHQASPPVSPGGSRFHRVVLVPRLTEVRALVGFTRFEPQGTDVDGELDLGAVRAPLDEPVTWLPAIENSGEGFFFSFETAALRRWEQETTAVAERAGEFIRGLAAWSAGERRTPSPEFASPRFVMLHSLSHLLITAVAAECGYTSSSIRERIYLGETESGVLLYTASTGAEGSLGGLVEAGRKLDRYLERALDLGRLCSNDPVCAEHVPSGDADRTARHLEGASCHGCLLISETSCERQNTFLDRSLVVPTVKSSAAAFFRSP